VWWYTWNPSCTAEESTFADIRLAMTSGAASPRLRSHAASISCGVRRKARPFPPATTRPVSASSPRSPSFSAPHAVVVTPLECQSNPSTLPSAWNHTGSDSRRSRPAEPSSVTTATEISRASATMRSNSHRGARPPCSGRSACPVRIVSEYRNRLRQLPR
jgi:hypothetical protein